MNTIKKFLNQHHVLALLLAFTFLKGIVYSVIVPLWEFPDEQAHFAEVSQIVETGREVLPADLSREIYISELVMGTLRDQRGNNQYTYNSTYRPPYTQTIEGLYETSIEQLPKQSRTEYVKLEAAKYPPLFYYLSSLGYRMAYGNGLITRVFFVRLISVIIFTFSVWVSYLIGQKLFNNKLYSLVLALMISFHPMFSFVSAGINNDNLTNLIGLILIWQVLDLFESGLNLKKSLSIGFAAGLGILTKPLILPLLIAVGIAFIWEWTYSKRSLVKQVSLLAPLIIVSSLSGGWLVIKPFLETGRVPYFTQQKEYGLSNLKFIEYLKPQLGQYYRETLVWYWGVYKWLGVILPLNLIRLIKVLMIISGIGIVVEIFRKRVVQKNYQPWLLAMISFVFIASLTYWDYNGVRSNGFSHGLQGRYFFPTIGAHMSLLLIGILSITPKVWRRLVAKMTAVGMIIAQLISLKTLITAYYSTESVRVLFIQMSQYKPWFLKYPFSSIWLSFYGVLLSVLVYKILVYNHKETINK